MVILRVAHLARCVVVTGVSVEVSGALEDSMGCSSCGQTPGQPLVNARSDRYGRAALAVVASEEYRARLFCFNKIVCNISNRFEI